MRPQRQILNVNVQPSATLHLLRSSSIQSTISSQDTDCCPRWKWGAYTVSENKSLLFLRYIAIVVQV